MQKKQRKTKRKKKTKQTRKNFKKIKIQTNFHFKRQRAFVKSPTMVSAGKATGFRTDPPGAFPVR